MKKIMLFVQIIIATLLIAFCLYKTISFLFIDIRTLPEYKNAFLDRSWSLFQDCLLVTAIFTVGWSLHTYRKMQDFEIIGLELNATFIGDKPQIPNWLRLRNITTEIATTAQIPPPRLYVQESEYCLNSFTMQFGKTSIIVVTKGLLDNLNREELKNIIAYEMSNIIKQNTKFGTLIYVATAGLLFFTSMGKKLLSVTSYVNQTIANEQKVAQFGKTMHDGKNKVMSNPNRTPVLVPDTPLAYHSLKYTILGFCLLPLGFAGALCTRIIKYLNCHQNTQIDNAKNALQFINRMSLAKTLQKIVTAEQGNILENQKIAEECSHLLLIPGQSLIIPQLEMHPYASFAKRIKDLDPNFNYQNFQKVYSKS